MLVLSFSLMKLESSLFERKASFIRISAGENLDSSFIAELVISLPSNSNRCTSPVEISARHNALSLALI